MIIVRINYSVWERLYRLDNMCFIDDKIKIGKLREMIDLKYWILIILVYLWKVYVLNNWKSINCFYYYWVLLNVVWLYINIKLFIFFYNYKLLISGRYC